MDHRGIRDPSTTGTSRLRRAEEPKQEEEHMDEVMPTETFALGITIWGLALIIGLPFWLMLWAKITGY